MKLGIKLIAGFLVVALVLVAIGGLAIILQGKVNTVKDEVDIIRDEQDSMLEFGYAIYEEHAVAVKSFTTYDPVDMDNYIAAKMAMNSANSIMSVSILTGIQENSTASPLHSEIASDFSAVIDLLNRAQTCFEENSTLYANYSLSQADVGEVLTALGGMIEDALNDPECSINSIVELMDSRTLSLGQDETAALALLNNSILAAIVVAIVLAIGIGFVLSKSMTSRLSDMIIAARSIKSGNLDVSVNETGNDEITELGRAFNQMILSVRLLTGDMGLPEKKENESSEDIDKKHGN